MRQSDLTDGVHPSGQGVHIVCMPIRFDRRGAYLWAGCAHRMRAHQIRLAGCVPLRVMRTSYARISDLTGRARHSEQGAHIVCAHIRSDRHGAFLWAECAQAQLARLHAISRNVAVLRSCGSPAAQAALMPNALRSATALTELFCGCAMPAV